MDREELKSLLMLLHPADIAFIKANVREGLIDEIMAESGTDQCIRHLSVSDLQWKCMNDNVDLAVSDFVKTKILNGL